ncbi:MAG: flagellar basal body P-ring protein FlgI [Planctomycetota bacterium]
MTHRAKFLVGLVLFTSLCGCAGRDQKKERYDLGVASRAGALAESAAYRDTLGAYGYFEGMAPLRVRGYGLVVGLGKNGAGDCPRPIHDKIVQSIVRQQRSTATVVGARELSPEALLADKDTAAVIVQGDIPAAATKGARFDVSVTALPGTQTKSLRGGRLYTTELEVFRQMPSGVSIMGKVLARASGPVFLNPFSDEQSATKSNPLEGVIVGGGVSLEDRRVRFVLAQPSYSIARQVEQRINARFGGAKKAADALSPSFIQLQVPEEFARETGHFLDLVRSLYLSRDPQFEATRARALAQEIVNPAAPHGRISLCFEGLGRSALPALDELYNHPKDYVSFYAAVAGMRLGDHVAADRVAMHAGDNAGEHRFPAIRALGEARGMASASQALRRLLEDADPRVRIAAYEALVDRGDPSIITRKVGGDNFALDLLATKGESFVYVTRSGTRRIALFGEGMTCRPPVLYRAADGSVTLSADADADHLTVLRTAVASGATSPPMAAPVELPRLIEFLGSEADVDEREAATGVGLDFGEIVRIVHQLSSHGAVNARFSLQEPNVAELFGPAEPVGRPESEL